MEKKLWYAVQIEFENRFGSYNSGCGSFNLDEAKKMAREFGPRAFICALDGEYDADGNQTAAIICEWEMSQDQFDLDDDLDEAKETVRNQTAAPIHIWEMSKDQRRAWEMSQDQF